MPAARNTPGPDRHLTVVPSPLQQLGCPEPDCTWRSQPFPAVPAVNQVPAEAVGAWVLHVQNDHPRWRLLIHTARQRAGRIGGQPG